MRPNIALRASEGGRVEVQLSRRIVDAAVLYPIGPRGGAGIQITSRHVKRESGAKSNDPVSLPSADDGARHALEPLQKGHLVHIVDGGVVSDVERIARQFGRAVARILVIRIAVVKVGAYAQ